MKSVLPHLSILDDRHDAMLRQVIELCEINSGTNNLPGLAAVKDRLVSMFASVGGELNLVDSEPDRLVDDFGRQVERPLGQSIHIVKRPDADRKVLLCIHMDTVYPQTSPFKKCVLRDDGTLNGPGVADAKGGIVVMLHALQAFESSPLADQLGWEVLLNADEEIGSPGSRHVIDRIAGRCDFGLLFEPSLPNNKLVSWRKGSGNFSVVVRGRSAHAGRDFANGYNAITAAAELATAISKLNTDPQVTYNVAAIDGGSPLNVVPDLAILRFNVRVKTPTELANSQTQIQSLVKKFDDDSPCQFSLHGGFRSPPRPVTPEMQALMRRIEHCGSMLDMPIGWEGTGGASDGNKFAAGGLVNVDTMGPCGGRIHSEQEYLVVDSLVPKAKLSALILMDYAGSAITES